jgi:hypothetical protein
MPTLGPLPSRPAYYRLTSELVPTMRPSVLALGFASLLAGCEGRDSALPTPGSSAGRDPNARTPLTELTRANLLQDDALTTALALGDVDRDGDLDLVAGNDGLSELLINDGLASFTVAPAGRLPLPAGSARAIVLADLNGDTIRDLVVGYDSAEGARFLVGDGRGGFVLRGDRGPALVRAIAAVDVDGDRDVDLAFACAGPGLPDRLLRNNGAGLFADASSLLPADSAVTVGVAGADLDGDGDVDLVFLDETGRLRLYRNNGNGAFTDARLDLPVSTQPATALALGDVDGDQDADVLVAGAGADSLFLNDGSGGLTAAPAGSLPADTATAGAVLLLDVDADDDRDVVLANRDAAGHVLVNDGHGRFTTWTEAGLRSLPDVTNALAMGDLDGNGSLDLAAGVTGSGNALYLKLPAGPFEEASRSGGLGPPDSALCAADLDGDGDLDLVLPNHGLILRNDGRGALAPRQLMPRPASPVRVCLALDADGDRDLDLFLGFDGQSRLLIQNGGSFADETGSRLPERRASTRAAVAFDLEGDRDLDLLLANADEPPRLYRNDVGTFRDLTAMALPSLNATFTTAVAGDLDGDGDVDAVLGGTAASGPASVVALYNYLGRLVDPLTLLTNQTGGLALGDVDRDGDLDLAIGTRAIGGSRPQNRILHNDGTGKFTLTSLAATDNDARGAALLDVDGDGDLDALFAGRRSAIWLNEGTVGFRDASASDLPADRVPCDAAVWFDVDRDGDLDLAASQPTGLHLLHNLQRHVFSPWPARLGATYRTEILARVTRAPAGQIAMCSLRLGPPEPPLPVPPFGYWSLGLTFVSGCLAIPAPSGIALVDLPIPSDRVLSGQYLTVQALIAFGTDPKQWRFTNVQSDRIVP